MHDRSLAQALERACVRAGLVDEQEKAIVSPYGLRHTAASIMLGAGVPLIVVSRQLGHANPNLTATIYAHLLSDAELERAAGIFDAPAVAHTMGETMGEVRACRDPAWTQASRRGDRPPCKRQVPGSNPGSGLRQRLLASGCPGIPSTSLHGRICVWRPSGNVAGRPRRCGIRCGDRWSAHGAGLA